MSFKTQTIVQKSIHAMLFVALAFVCLMGMTACATSRTISEDRGMISEEVKVSKIIGIGEIRKPNLGVGVEVLMDFQVEANLPRDRMSALLISALDRAIKVQIVAPDGVWKSSHTVFDMKKITVEAIPNGFRAKIDRADYIFFGAATLPEKIIVRNGQEPSLTFDGKTKKLIGQ